MKLKDIEKRLIREHNEVSVPDVCDKAKKTPINRLLSPPQRAFAKKFAERMLMASFVLLLVTIFALIVLWSMPNSASPKQAVFACLVVNAEGHTHTIGLFMQDDKVIVATVIEDTSYTYTAMSQYASQDVESAIKAVYDINLIDNVRVCAISDDADEQARAIDLIASALSSLAIPYSNDNSLTVATSVLIANLDNVDAPYDGDYTTSMLISSYLVAINQA